MKVIEMSLESSIIFSIRAVTGHGGGAEKVFAALVCALSSRKIDLNVLAFDSPKPTFYSLGDVDIAYLSILDPHRSTRASEFIKILGLLRSLFRRNNNCLIFAFMHSTYIPILFACLGFGHRIICVEHASAEYMSRGIARRLMRLLSNYLCCRKVFVSRSQMSSRELANPDKFLVIRNPIDSLFLCSTTTCIENRFSREHSYGSGLRLLFVGTLRDEKNLRSLLMALSSCKSRGSFTLDVVGDGPLREELLRLSDSLALSEVVSFHGSMNSQKICDFYDRSDLCVIPSLYESFSLVAVESLSRGLPVLSFSRCTGLLEHVVHQVNGFLITPEEGESDCSALVRALETVSSKELVASLTAGARSFDASRFSLEKIVDEWVQLIDECNV